MDQFRIDHVFFSVEIHNIMSHKSAQDIFERDSQTAKDKWQHLENDRVASLAEKFLQVTLKMLNVLVHLIEDVNPNVHLNKSGIALPGSPVRRKTQGKIGIIKTEKKRYSVFLLNSVNAIQHNILPHLLKFVDEECSLRTYIFCVRMSLNIYLFIFYLFYILTSRFNFCIHELQILSAWFILY